MIVIVTLTLSILLQFVAAFMAFRLIPLTGRRLAWSLISAALMFMALRRCIPLMRMLSGDTTFRPDLNAELIALVISLLMAVGISTIAPIFTDRKRAEEALQESEEKHRKVADFTYAWEYWLAPDGKYIYVSPACERISGYRVEEFHQDPTLLEKIIHPDDKHRLAVHFHDMLQGKSDACELEFRIITRDGQERWISHACQDVYSHTDEYLGRRGSNSDITDRKRAEEELKEKDKFMESMVQSSAVATFVVNLEHKVIYWNMACEDLTGIKSEDLLGTSDHWKVFYDHPRPCVADVIIDNKFDEMTNLYKVYAKSVLIPDGICAEGWYPNLGGKNRYIVFDAAPIRDDNGKITAAIETLQDITERKQAEDALRESEERFRALSENAPDIIYTMNHLGAITYVNPSWKRALGHDEKEILGRYFIDFAKEEDKRTYRKLFKSFRDEGKSINNYTGVMLTKDGKERVFNMNSAFNLDSQGRITGVVGSMKDITEIRDIEKILGHAQKMEAIGTLAGGIAHDFNNILAAIIGYAQLATDAPDEERRKRYLNQILKSGERATDLTSRILAFSRQDQQERRPVELAGIVTEVINLLRAVLPTTIEIQQELESQPHIILSSSVQIHQVLMNLCTNAAHAMREKGGVLEIRLDHIALRAGENPMIPDLRPGPYVRLTVKDTGHGIDPGIIDLIFDPFFTTKKVDEGTGLGLSVVYGIVKSHGGTISVQSEPGKGSAFSVYFPRIDAEIEQKSEKQQPILGRSEHVLFVDGEPFLAEIGNEGLSALGYKVTVRTSSIEALAAFRAQPHKFDIVITDMTMPNMTGVQLASEILKIRPDIPIILCTGYSDLIDEEKSKKLGVWAFLMKPVLLEEIARTIRKVLDKKD